MIRAHWQDRIEVALGLWLVASPFVLGLETTQAAAWSAMVAGVAIVTFAVDAFYYPEIVEEWGNLAIGLLLLASPWLLGYAPVRIATINAVVCGVAIAALSFSTVGDIRRERRARALRGES
ncbi:MAG: SPW repeat protein [Burkholderiaceae bacterium]|nr:SPW repeat protein [Burkholderiaceae bacterium]MCD6673015.1 SPW repeat protein [Burkholderiaceae bacterium]